MLEHYNLGQKQQERDLRLSTLSNLIGCGLDIFRFLNHQATAAKKNECKAVFRR